MKIHLYDTDTGWYLGEDFASGSLWSAERGRPSGATALAPPPYGPGQVPVFRASSQAWEIIGLPLSGCEREKP